MIFSQLGIGWAAHLLNFIILTAALSVYNSGMYANSRMLFGLAKQGNAPKVFLKVNKQGVPIPAVLFSALLIFGCVLLNYFVPEDALSHHSIGAASVEFAEYGLSDCPSRRRLRSGTELVDEHESAGIGLGQHLLHVHEEGTVGTEVVVYRLVVSYIDHYSVEHKHF